MDRESDIMKNRKGFTLVELLATILIIGLVLSVTAVTIISSVKKSKDNVKVISYEGFKSSVFTYAEEFKKDDIYWNRMNDNTVYACTTVRALKNKGFFDNNTIIYDKNKNELNDSSYVMVTKNNITFTLLDVLIDDEKCNDNFDVQVTFTPNGDIGYDNWYKNLDINYSININDKSKIDNISYNLNVNDKEVTKATTNDFENQVEVTKEGSKINLCVVSESLNGTVKEICSDNYKLDMTKPSKPSFTLNNDGNVTIKDGTDSLSGIKESLASFTNNNFSNKDSILNTLNNYNDGIYNVYAVSMDKAKNYSDITHAIYTVKASSNGTASYHSDTTGYKCSLNGITYKTLNEANAACKKTETINATKNEYYTYSCPSGYTCSNGTCNSSSKCTKTVSKTPDKLYYCAHNKKYQSSSVCSYTGEELASTDLYCVSNGNSCTENYYYYCNTGTLSGSYCYIYGKYAPASSSSGWNSYQSGSCRMDCEGPGNSQGIVTCSSGVVSCSNLGQDFSCKASDGSVLGGYKYCSKTTLYTWYRSADVGTKKSCTDVGRYKENGYSGCRNNYSTGSGSTKFNYENGFSCSGTGTGLGTLSCTYSGYTLSSEKKYIIDSNGNDSCKQPLKVYNGSYCNTAKYHEKNVTCTPGNTSKGGASTVYTRTCVNNNPPSKYYCSLTESYSDSSTCSKTYTENVTSTKNVSYSCPSGYTKNSSNNTCSKTTNGTITAIKDNYYTCSLFSGKKYNDEASATSACTNYCENGLKYYSKKNKCVSLKGE